MSRNVAVHTQTSCIYDRLIPLHFHPAFVPVTIGITYWLTIRIQAIRRILLFIRLSYQLVNTHVSKQLLKPPSPDLNKMNQWIQHIYWSGVFIELSIDIFHTEDPRAMGFSEYEVWVGTHSRHRRIIRAASSSGYSPIEIIDFLHGRTSNGRKQYRDREL